MKERMTDNGMVNGAIRDWLRDNVTGGRSVDDDFPILDNGVLTSLQTVELVLFLEQQFAISISEDDFVEENFASIDAIAGLVQRKLA
jgi:methoxymalonate biosynthesis acyl carrier protein